MGKHSGIAYSSNGGIEAKWCHRGAVRWRRKEGWARPWFRNNGLGGQTKSADQVKNNHMLPLPQDRTHRERLQGRNKRKGRWQGCICWGVFILRRSSSQPNEEFPECQRATWISQLGYHVLIRWNCEILCRSDIVAATIVQGLDFGLWGSLWIYLVWTLFWIGCTAHGGVLEILCDRHIHYSGHCHTLPCHTVA